jgi:hypothetical protein
VEWLARARGGGADVALVGAAPPVAADVRVRQLASIGPLSLIRALDAESQIRPLDAVVAFGRRARLLGRVVPRGSLAHITQETDPRSIDWSTRA